MFLRLSFICTARIKCNMHIMHIFIQHGYDKIYVNFFFFVVYNVNYYCSGKSICWMTTFFFFFRVMQLAKGRMMDEKKPEGKFFF
ncbi:hypothetical protein RhiirC2_257225 [Rhizophagus irregularis]|uniref:Uncharacterized protein n=1 Tax=Rhizophagus irregularis TaxID=588596 RepID=A0A2N1NMP4_9GLOM|nr:hypothetical protein RhiirC2_257225 [Rhizophagus irregularis]